MKFLPFPLTMDHAGQICLAGAYLSIGEDSENQLHEDITNMKTPAGFRADSHG